MDFMMSLSDDKQADVGVLYIYVTQDKIDFRDEILKPQCLKR